MSSSGAATYTIPLFTPPGPRGMQPSIALVYNSNGGAGYVGKGWSIAGLSAIDRCSKSIAQDGEAEQVLLESADAYCRDGNRLRLQSGTYGASGSVYYTEMADFSRITASGTAGNGPASWSVERKDGSTWTYGGTSDSRVLIDSTARRWLISQMEDSGGNKILFTYKSPDSTTIGTTHPVKIEWTQTSASSGSYLYSMEFDYASDGNALASSYSGYVAGEAVRDTDLLSSISVKHESTTVRKYVLDYDTSPTTGAKRLTDVEECSNAAETDCLAPTTIVYQDGEVGVVTSASFSTSISATATIGPGNYDYNGDGIKDLTYRRDGAWYVRMGSLSGYGGEIATGVDEFGLLAGDPFGNGRNVILGRITGTWYVYYWNGSSFSSTSTGITGIDLVTLRDADADGRDDLVYVTYVMYSAATYMGIGVRPSTSTGATPSFGSLVETEYIPSIIPGQEYGVVFDGGGIGIEDYTRGSYDANGDGREDLIVYGNFLYYDDVWEDWLWQYFEAMLVAEDNNLYQELLVTDSYNIYPIYLASSLNSDRCGDAFTSSHVKLSNCAGDTITTATAGTVMGMTDWNADGRQDFLVLVSSTLHVQLSTGEGLGSAQSVSLPSGCTGAFMDANGDGLEDYVCRDGTTLYTYLHDAATETPDLAVSFTDGYGVVHGLGYTISTHEGYTPNSDATYPQQDLTGARTLARLVSAPDGAGGTYTRTYSYFGATEDLHGRGWRGFEKIEMVDSRSGIKRVRGFEREFPYTGMLIEEAFRQGGGALISQRIVTPASTTLDATAYNQRYFPYPASSTEDVYEVGGTKDEAWIARTVVSNTFDSWGNLTASTRTVTDKDSSSPLYGYYWTQAIAATITPNTTYWCLGLPTATSVAYSTNTGEDGLTRSMTYTPDYVNCRMDELVTEPSGGNRRVDTSFVYDDFGNIESVSVIGRDPNADPMDEREALIGWGTTGQFPESATDALSNITTRTFDSTFGSLATETDPNGILVVDNTYDDFGRLERTDRADGTYTLYTLILCAPNNYCENGDPGSGATSINKTIATATDYASNDSQIRFSHAYLDLFDRPIVHYEQTLSGGLSRVGRQYDQLGHVYRETAPCVYGSCSVYWTTNTYDLLGRLIHQSRPQSQSVGTPVTTTFLYEGLTRKIADPQGKNTLKILDVNGWMRRSQDHDGYYQSFSYDAAGSLAQVTDSLSNTLFEAEYSYGIQAFQDETVDMDLGAWSYSYNSLGELVAWEDAKSQSFSQSYDALSRVTSRTEPEGTTYFVWGDDPDSDNIGQLDYMSMSGYLEEFDYDGIGRLSTQTITTDQEYAIDYDYTNQGLLDTLTYPTSTSSTRVKVKYGYAYGILQSVRDWTGDSGGTWYWTADTQNPRGQTTQETLGNGVVTNRVFDAVSGWLDSIQSGPSGGTTLQNQSYLYDMVGNVTQRLENTQGLTEDFHYDNLYRLDYSELDSEINLDLTYDAMGNITAHSEINDGASWTYHGSKEHAVVGIAAGGENGAISYSYDANGNMTSRAGGSITWSSFNYPTSLATSTESTDFYYGPNRQYYLQEYTGPAAPGGYEYTHYVGGILEKVYANGVTDWRHYIRAEGQTVAIVSRKSTSTNAVYYPLEDHQGSGSTLTNSGGTNLVRQSYEAFGLPRDASDWDGVVSGGDQTIIDGISRRGYTGHSMLGAMGLIHMNGRVQDAITGRFLSPDPYVQSPGFTQSFNRYAYVYNNPLSFIDPSGFMSEDGWPLPPSEEETECFWSPMSRTECQYDGVNNALCEKGWDFFCDWSFEDRLRGYQEEALFMARNWPRFVPLVTSRGRAGGGTTTGSVPDPGPVLPIEPTPGAPVVGGDSPPQGSVFNYFVEGIGWTLVAFDIANTLVSPGPDTGIFGAGLIGGARAARAIAPSSRALGRALEAAGHVRPPGSAAHHIVAGSAERAAPARAVLDRFGIGINDAANGAFLRSGAHNGIHTNAYYETVNSALSQVTTRQEALQVLDALRRGLP